MAGGAGTSVGDARALLRCAHDLVKLVSEVEHGRESLRHDVESAFTALREQMVPGLAPRIDGNHALAGADTFRRAVAPVYLRRNQEDVLTELPQLIHSDDWVEFGRHDFLAYLAAVHEGNFMAMRRAAFSPGTPDRSTKLRRLLEIVEESAANERKVVIFSYFRDVLEAIFRSVDAAHGPITGNVSPNER